MVLQTRIREFQGWEELLQRTPVIGGFSKKDFSTCSDLAEAELWWALTIALMQKVELSLTHVCIVRHSAVYGTGKEREGMHLRKWVDVVNLDDDPVIEVVFVCYYFHIF